MEKRVELLVAHKDYGGDHHRVNETPFLLPHRITIEGPTLKAEYGLNQFKADQALLKLVPLLPTTLDCFRSKSDAGGGGTSRQGLSIENAL